MNFLISCISASNRMPRNAFQPPDGSGRHKKIYPASGIYSADGPIDATSGRMARVSVFYRRHVPSVRRGKQPVQRGRRTAGTRAAVRWRAGNPAYGTKVRKNPPTEEIIGRFHNRRTDQQHDLHDTEPDLEQAAFEQEDRNERQHAGQCQHDAHVDGRLYSLSGRGLQGKGIEPELTRVAPRTKPAGQRA